MRTFLSIMSALAGLAAGHGALAQELTGTPYSLLWRGAAYAQVQGYGRQVPQPPAAAVMLRLVDVAARRELSRAVFDGRLGGWMFEMPFAGVDARAGRCLALVDPRNQYLPVRQPSAVDTGANFRHPPWDRELARLGELAELKREYATVEAQARSAAGDITRLAAEPGLPAGAAQCPLPPPPPEPPRPAGALESAQADAVSGAVCAWRWDRDHGGRVNLARIFSDAGLDADWRDRTAVSGTAESLPGLRLPITGGDLALVLDAAAKGRTFMEHADGVRMLGRVQAACRAEVGRQASAARQRWLEAVQETRQQPERARLQCVQKLEQISKLQATQAAAPNFLEALDKKIMQLSTPPAANDAMPLQNQLCQP